MGVGYPHPWHDKSKIRQKFQYSKKLGRHGLMAVPVSCNQTLVVSSNQFGGNYAKLNAGIGTWRKCRIVTQWVWWYDGCMETSLKYNVSIFITGHWQLSTFVSLRIEDYLAVRGLRTDWRWSRGCGWQGGSSCVLITVTIVCVTNSLVPILTWMTKTGKSPGKVLCGECHCLVITLGHKIHWIWNNSYY